MNKQLNVLLIPKLLNISNGISITVLRWNLEHNYSVNLLGQIWNNFPELLWCVLLLIAYGSGL